MNQSQHLSADEYLVTALRGEAEIKVKGSRFIAAALPTASKEEAESIYKQFKKRYFKATHNCFAFRIDAATYRFSDDGEPSGTAGKPILQAIYSFDLFETLCIVTRYWGGTKLGTGGLIRAYGQAAQEALKKAGIKIKVRTHSCRLIFNYENENAVRRLLNQCKGKITESEYSDQISMYVVLPESNSPLFKQQLLEMLHSNITII